MPKDFGNKMKWEKRKKRVRSNLKAAGRKDKQEDVDKTTKWTEVVRVVISKIIGPSRITWTREIGPKRDNFRSSHATKITFHGFPGSNSGTRSVKAAELDCVVTGQESLLSG